MEPGELCVEETLGITNQLLWSADNCNFLPGVRMSAIMNVRLNSCMHRVLCHTEQYVGNYSWGKV